MTSSRGHEAFAVAAAVLALSGCAPENEIESGLRVHMAEAHTEGRPGEVVVTPGIIPNSGTVQGGYDQVNLEKHPIRDVNARTLLLYRAYLVLDGVELVPCAGIARLRRILLDSLIRTAHAHPGHGSEPVGGRSLDKPNVIDIVTQEGFVLPLGDKAMAPGPYCGVKVTPVRATADAYGKPAFAAASNDDPTTRPEVPEMAGRVFAICADYCDEVDGSGQCTRRVKVDIDDNGLALPGVQTLQFDQPLELNAALREIFVVVGVAYGEWARDVDVTRLGIDAGERQKLLNNMAASLHVNSKGLGDLPPNLPQ
jgi:hypothetical protein